MGFYCIIYYEELNMKFKVGQKVYYYQVTGEYIGGIVEGIITKAIKDLATNKITYTVDTAKDCWWVWSREKELTADYLYSSRKAIEKEYKEEIIYNNLYQEMRSLEKILDQVYAELTKDAHKDFNGLTLSINGENKFSTLYVNANDINIEGIGSVKEKVDELNREIAELKKKIKPKTKKQVIKKDKEENTELEELAEIYAAKPADK